MATTEEEISDLKAKIAGYVYSMKRSMRMLLLVLKTREDYSTM
jgi:hypothetical protein